MIVEVIVRCAKCHGDVDFEQALAYGVGFLNITNIHLCNPCLCLLEGG